MKTEVNEAYESKRESGFYLFRIDPGGFYDDISANMVDFGIL